MTTSPSLPPTAAANNLFAAVDMGTNSFKLTLVRVDPSSGRFFTLHRLKKPLLLGLDTTTLSASSLDRSISTLLHFQSYLRSHRLPPSHLRIVATSAVRESSNNSEFIRSINEALGCCQVEILSGTEEARLTYLGILQFFPLFNSRVLAIDIGGGSTEFTVGLKGNVLFAKSLRLGHVTLTQEFTDVIEMREHIREVIKNSGLTEKIKEFKLDAVVGSSGTIKAIEKAVGRGYTHGLEENLGVFEGFVERDWKFSREDLRCFVGRLHDEAEMGSEGKTRMVGFFKGRARFILAGTILLDEIFGILGIEEIKVSGYALGEGVITEMLGQVLDGFDLSVNARWRSVVRLSSKFNNKKRMKSSTDCAGIARDIFEGLRKKNELCDNGNDNDESLMSLDDRDLEYLEAASLLHNIGFYTGKKGYHKQSFRIIMNGNHLHGYTTEEIELIGLLVKHHRKKFPKREALDDSIKESVKQKFGSLCAIMRLSVAMQQCLPENFQIMEFVHSSVCFQLSLAYRRGSISLTNNKHSLDGSLKEPTDLKAHKVLSDSEVRNQPPNIAHPVLSEHINSLMEKELEHFGMVFKKKISIVFS